jgi:hypothetical protein
MSQISGVLRSCLLVVAGLGLLSCPMLFGLGMLAPRALGFLDPVVCPPGMQLNNASSQQTNDEGNEVTAVNLVCTAAGARPVDVTGKILLVLFALPALGVAVLVVRALIPKPAAGAAATPGAAA